MLIYSYKVANTPRSISNPPKGYCPSTDPSTDLVAYTHMHVDVPPPTPPARSASSRLTPLSWGRRGYSSPTCLRASSTTAHPSEEAPRGITPPFPVGGPQAPSWRGLLLAPHGDTVLPGPGSGRDSPCGCSSATRSVSPPLQIFFYTSFQAYTQLQSSPDQGLSLRMGKVIASRVNPLEISFQNSISSYGISFTLISSFSLFNACLWHVVLISTISLLSFANDDFLASNSFYPPRKQWKKMKNFRGLKRINLLD